MVPYLRPRRLRENAVIRRMVRETRLSTDQLIYPMFVVEGHGIRQEIGAMPGQYRYSVDLLTEELRAVRDAGIPAVILFGIPDSGAKDSIGSASYDPNGVVCRALRAARKEIPDLLLIADVCLCEYTDHGHCGIPVQSAEGDFRIDNDSSLQILAKAAVAYAEAGAHVVAPSDMMDGRVAAIREALDQKNLQTTAILSYAAKYASAFYGPFREAAESAPQFGDRKSYQMDPANAREALREVVIDLEEGADMVMVKPALPYLDVIRQVRDMVEVPVAAYNVSGEYSALCAAFEKGWLQREATIRETLLSIHRAGAALILTYFAKEAAEMIRKGAM
ncbi:MAG TPA: porphobilinogen synthase [Acidobacteriota bacterium]|nr:porphobilinogen synthase [Acidobacteriota bacterium]